MVVIPSLRAVFIHIPRTGGWSLTQALLDSCPDAVFDAYFPRIHCTYHELDDILRQWRCFTIMRNPWDLMRSQWGWVQMEKRNRRGLAYEQMEYVHRSQHNLEQYTRTMIEAGWPLRPPGWWQTFAGDERVETFLYEDNPYDRVAQYLGISLVVPRVNCSPRMPYTWTPGAVEMIADTCRDDVERFNYQPPPCGD